MQIDEILFSTGNYLARRLCPADLALVLTFSQRCSDLFMLQNGTPPNGAEAEKIFIEAPPGRKIEDKLPMGVFDSNNEMVGLLDVLRDYRIKFEWWIGLMLLVPSSRKAGLARRIHDAFESYAFRSGAQRLLLAVLEENTEAHRFWTKLGYRAVKNHPQKRYGSRVHACTEYEKTLPERAMIRVRCCLPEDEKAVFALARDFATSFPVDQLSFSKSFSQVLSSARMCLAVAQSSDAVIGYVLGTIHPTFYANGHVAWLEEVMVKEGFRKKGVGRLLMKTFEIGQNQGIVAQSH